MPDESQKVLQYYYSHQRAHDVAEEGRTTTRLLESLIRLAQAHARLMYRNVVEIDDALMGCIVMDSSMIQTSILDVASVLHGHFPKPNEADDIFICPRGLIEVSEFERPLLTISQVHFLISESNISPIDVQHRFICLNTLLFSKFITKKESGSIKELQKHLKSWNDFVGMLVDYCKKFRKGFGNTLKSDKRIPYLYQKEYEDLCSNMFDLNKIDVQTQKMMFHYDNGVFFENTIPLYRWKDYLENAEETLKNMKRKVEDRCVIPSS